jgi:hypothetical protein
VVATSDPNIRPQQLTPATPRQAHHSRTPTHEPTHHAALAGDFDRGRRLGLDRCAFLMDSVGTHDINAALYPKMPYDPIKDFVQVTLVACMSNVLAIYAAFALKHGIRSMADFIHHAKASPGKPSKVSSGNTCADFAKHIAAESTNERRG